MSFDTAIAFLQHMKLGNILLVQASLIILIPYLLWRTLRLGKWFPLGVVQIFAGVLLGPSIFGALAPELFKSLFGVVTLGADKINRADPILALATIAVCLFGFLAGADADKEVIGKSGKTIASIGVIGMIVGWTLGALAGAALYYVVPAAVATPGATDAYSKPSPLIFAIAYGLITAVSALPILAVILRELAFTQHRIGAIALASAGIADTMMWLGLAVIVALSGSGTLGQALAIALAGGALSFLFVRFVASPVLNRLIASEAPESALMTVAALSIFVASAITSLADLHPVLGAFVAGVFLPDKIREMAAHRLDQPTTLILMPFFFLNTGLRTTFTFNDPDIWILFGVSTLLCIVGKTLGHGLAARAGGETWPFSIGAGVLLQTKGLMGIIVLLVFTDRHLISGLMFSAGVLMCIASTGLSAPVMRGLVKLFGNSLLDGNRSIPLMVRVEEPPVTVAPGTARPLAMLDFTDGRGTFLVRSPNLLIGRHSQDDIRINDISVSRHHARLLQGAEGRFELYNLTADRSEANPITVNGVRREHAVLADGDKVGIGTTEFTFRSDVTSKIVEANRDS
ncbi:cation:proton antiporter domain-containing protein [Bradyrhizobium sp. HKCCYLS20291]|uniref:cation:proton antiporter domain-containing protein n=1 Tax=Bradyrhizobium sp. HKCCYLS20291 TaxID=3420766 RepID=UPI003EBBD9CA